MPTGRFAPSPTGDLHLGNLRTALVAWLFARHDHSAFLLRFEDLDSNSVRDEYYQRQAADLALLGLDWDQPVVRQSDRLDIYTDAIARLVEDDRVYPCYCSRREIREATQAPNGPAVGDAYPGTCRDLSSAGRSQREQAGRTPALRLRSGGAEIELDDLVAGHYRGPVDDLVVQRNDGVPAYHLVVVVDDAAAGIELVVRADDLLPSTPGQLHLAALLGLPAIRHAHVPLVLSPTGSRLAKRDGAVTLADRAALGESAADVRSYLAESLRLCEPGEPVTPTLLLERFDPTSLPTEPLTLDPAELEPAEKR